MPFPPTSTKTTAEAGHRHAPTNRRGAVTSALVRLANLG
jgi:hypothetical protein